MANAEETPPSACKKAMDFYWGNYLPLMMIFVVFFGYFVPGPGVPSRPPALAHLHPAAFPGVADTGKAMAQVRRWTNRRSNCAEKMTQIVTWAA